jgi:hypothetical protein
MEFGIEYPRSGKKIECADEDSARRLFESAPQTDEESLALVINGKWNLVRGRTLAKLRADFPMAAKLYDRLNEHGLVISQYVSGAVEPRDIGSELTHPNRGRSSSTRQ